MRFVLRYFGYPAMHGMGQSFFFFFGMFCFVLFFFFSHTSFGTRRAIDRNCILYSTVSLLFGLEDLEKPSLPFLTSFIPLIYFFLTLFSCYASVPLLQIADEKSKQTPVRMVEAFV